MFNKHVRNTIFPYLNISTTTPVASVALLHGIWLNTYSNSGSWKGGMLWDLCDWAYPERTHCGLRHIEKHHLNNLQILLVEVFLDLFLEPDWITERRIRAVQGRKFIQNLCDCIVAFCAQLFSKVFTDFFWQTCFSLPVLCFPPFPYEQLKPIRCPKFIVRIPSLLFFSSSRPSRNLHKGTFQLRQTIARLGFETLCQLHVIHGNITMFIKMWLPPFCFQICSTETVVKVNGYTCPDSNKTILKNDVETRCHIFITKTCSRGLSNKVCGKLLHQQPTWLMRGVFQILC